MRRAKSAIIDMEQRPGAADTDSSGVADRPEADLGQAVANARCRARYWPHGEREALSCLSDTSLAKKARRPRAPK